MSRRRTERVAAIAVLTSTLAVVSQLKLSPVPLAVTVLFATLSVGFGLFLSGWLFGSRRITHIACQPDGQWVLSEASGRTLNGELAGHSRVTGFALWLAWDCLPGRSLLLLPGDVPAEDFRRLVVRLRLSARSNRVEQIRET